MTAPHRSAKDGAALVVAEVLGLSSLHGRPRPPRLIGNQGNQPPRMALGGGGAKSGSPRQRTDELHAAMLQTQVFTLGRFISHHHARGGGLSCHCSPGIS